MVHHEEVINLTESEGRLPSPRTPSVLECALRCVPREPSVKSLSLLSGKTSRLPPSSPVVSRLPSGLSQPLHVPATSLELRKESLPI